MRGHVFSDVVFLQFLQYLKMSLRRLEDDEFEHRTSASEFQKYISATLLSAITVPKYFPLSYFCSLYLLLFSIIYNMIKYKYIVLQSHY